MITQDDVLIWEFQIGALRVGRKPDFVYRDLLWSIDGGRTFFGKGNLDDQDLKNIFDALVKRKDHMIFTAWEEDQRTHAIIRISRGAGVTYPRNCYLHMRYIQA